MNLVKELRNIAEKRADEALKEANEILNFDTERDNEMLAFFGRSEVEKNANLKGTSALEIMKEGNRVTLHDVKHVCVKYLLRYARAIDYKKQIPAHALSDLRKFKEKNKFSEYSFRHSLKIIAPLSHFNTIDAPIKDPVLVFEHSEDNIEIISTWGNDFSSMRIFSSFLYRYWILLSSIILIISSIYITINTSGATCLIWNCGLTLIFIVQLITLITKSDNNTFFIDKWNTNYK